MLAWSRSGTRSPTRLGAGFQSTQALYGLGSGGFFGVGIGHSVEKYGWLPEAHTDFIFAIIGEETGLLGTTLVMLGFLLFAVRGYRAGLRAPDRFGVVLATAITTWIAFEALLNMATVTNTLPDRRGAAAVLQLWRHCARDHAGGGRRAPQHRPARLQRRAWTQTEDECAF